MKMIRVGFPTVLSPFPLLPPVKPAWKFFHRKLVGAGRFELHYPLRENPQETTNFKETIGFWVNPNRLKLTNQYSDLHDFR